jgi:hypothetical protein
MPDSRGGGESSAIAEAARAYAIGTDRVLAQVGTDLKDQATTPEVLNFKVIEAWGRSSALN